MSVASNALSSRARRGRCSATWGAFRSSRDQTYLTQVGASFHTVTTAQLGIRLAAVCWGTGRWFRRIRKDSSHAATTCQANIAAVVETLRQKGRANQALRKLYVSRVTGKCTELEWQQIVELQGGKCFDCKKAQELTKGHLVPIVHSKSSLNASNVVGVFSHDFTPRITRKRRRTPTNRRFARAQVPLLRRADRGSPAPSRGRRAT